MRKILVSFVFVFFSSWLVASELTIEQKLEDLEQAAIAIRSGYGPLEYKKSELGIDLEQIVAAYKEKIAATKTNADFYYLMVQFIAEFKDSHFGASVPSDYRATLGFVTDLVQGKIVIESIDREVLSIEAFPFQRGDEIVSIDGISAEDFLNEYAGYFGHGYELTSKRTAAAFASTRSGRKVKVPTGEVSLVIKPYLRPFSNGKEVKLHWIVEGEPLDLVPKLEEGNETAEKGLNKRNSMKDFQVSIAPVWEELNLPKSERSFRCSGSTRIGIPEDATMIMEKPFVAYYHPTEFGNIGYLRIPHYFPRNEITGEMEGVKRFLQYQYAVKELEANTAGLIIDQDHNCGGSVFYLEDLLGLFLDKPYEGMKFKFLATKASYLDFNSWAQGSWENTLEGKALREIADIVKDSWLSGDYMTDLHAFRGEAYGYFVPNRVRYTKPIVMLIDEMSGSGGDAFPAHMQGEGRAKLLGTRTMGAGGHVEEIPGGLNNSGIQIRLTKSLFFRPDGVAVENNGAVPDYPYEITVDDYVNEFSGYQQFYIQKVGELIKAQTAQ